MAHDPVPTLSHNIGWQAFDSISLDRNAANLNPGMLDAENGAGEGTVSDGTKAGDGTPAIARELALISFFGLRGSNDTDSCSRTLRWTYSQPRSPWTSTGLFFQTQRP